MKVSRTKLIGVGLVLFNAIGFVLNKIPATEAYTGVSLGMAMITGRAAIDKVTGK